MSSNKFNSFKEFYPFYLSQHSKKGTKILHAIGSISVISLTFYCFITKSWIYILFAPLLGYGFAWYSHFFIEKNKPATFKYPVYSFIGDWIMLKDLITKKIKL
tara:strand:+ start:407 stop:715 length:309 start_codon:yes stop_codon:yes gene_type:complete